MRQSKILLCATLLCGFFIMATSSPAFSEVIFADDFNDNVIDSAKWIPRGYTVAEQESMMKVMTTVTDNGGALESAHIPVNNKEPLTITRKVKVHYGNEYFGADGMAIIPIGALTKIFRITYGNMAYAGTIYGNPNPFCAYYGFFVNRNNSIMGYCYMRVDASPVINPIWDTWFDEKIVYYPATGQLEYFMNGEKKMDYNVGILPETVSHIKLGFTASGWWRDHYQYFDNISVEQAPYLGQNDPPVLTPIGNKTVQEGELLSFTVSATDPNGDAITWEATGLPAGASFDAATQTFTWTPTYNQSGDWIIEIAVSDNRQGWDVEAFTITVGNTNRSPVFAPIGEMQVTAGQTLQFNVEAVDPDGDNIVYSATSFPVPDGALFDATQRVFIWTPNYNQTGTYNVTFYAKDDGLPNATGTTNVIISVDSPSPCALSEQIINEILTLQLHKDVENSYMANLKKVCIFVQDGQTDPAINQLRAFVTKAQQDIYKGLLDGVNGKRLEAIATQAISTLKKTP